MKHYTKEALELYRNGKMSLLGRINCATHLKKCKKCTEILKELCDDDLLIKELRSSVMLYNKLSSKNSTQ